MATSPKHRPNSRLPRRGVIGAVGGAAAAAVLTPAVLANTGSDGSDGSSAKSATEPGTTTDDFPQTRSKAASGAAATASTAFPIGYVGVRWKGSRAGAKIRLRQEDGAERVRPLDSDDCGSANSGATLVAADSATRFEVEMPSGADDVQCLAVDTVHGPKKSRPVPEETTRMRGTPYLSRAGWGADESKRFLEDGSENTPREFYPLQTISVHHTATDNDDPDPAATVRAIYELHAITNDWGDIGYHFLIDEAGTIYEGRYSTDGGLPAFDNDGNLVTAFHVGGFNSGNLGIGLLGTLTERELTEATRNALTKLISIITRFHGLDPQGETTYVNPVNQVTRDVPIFSGHRDWLETECPGEVMYAQLDAVRKAVAR